jgi:hypothetical protein
MRNSLIGAIGWGLEVCVEDTVVEGLKLVPQLLWSLKGLYKMLFAILYKNKSVSNYHGFRWREGKTMFVAGIVVLGSLWQNTFKKSVFR